MATFVIIAGLISYGFTLFAEYHAKGRWAKNVTGLLAGIGMLISNNREVMRTTNTWWQNFWIGAAGGAVVASGLMALWWQIAG